MQLIGKKSALPAEEDRSKSKVAVLTSAASTEMFHSKAPRR